MMHLRRRWHLELSLSLPPPHLFITLGKRRLRVLQAIGRSLVGRRNRPPRTHLGDLLQKPPPLRFPDDHLPVDATDDRVIDHGIVIVRPIVGSQPSMRAWALDL